MNATDYRKQLEKRVKQTFGPDKNLVEAVLYLMRRLEAEEDDVRSQLLAQQPDPEERNENDADKRVG